ncbi:MAG: hypothetical protein K2W84_16635 [Burkholderiales bacterium]|nr:hypothetical protein [Burkholderiales bacterium]
MTDTATKYREVYGEFSALLDYSVALIETQSGHTPNGDRESYAEKIFGKMVCHGISLKRLSPSPSFPSNELWDISSNYAIARALIETYEALAYVSLEPVEEGERAFRILLWKLHAEERRREMLRLIGSNHPGISEVESKIVNLRSELLSHPNTSALEAAFRGKIEKGETPLYHLSRAERDSRLKINPDYHRAVIMHLSSHVHTHPFSIYQLFDFNASDPECVRLMSVPLQYCIAFLGKATLGMSDIFSPRMPPRSDQVSQTIENWVNILAKGVKGVG